MTINKITKMMKGRSIKHPQNASSMNRSATAYPKHSVCHTDYQRYQGGQQTNAKEILPTSGTGSGHARDYRCRKDGLNLDFEDMVEVLLS